MDDLAYFSADYEQGRARFRERAEAAPFRPLPPQPVAGDPGAAAAPLTIDAAVAGPDDAEETIIFSSGLHGVEGAAGAAGLLAIMDAVGREGLLPGKRIVLIRSLNPYGEEHGRRGNENGVDLNRNFLADWSPGPKGAADGGSTPEYRKLNALLNPTSPPPRLDMFYAAAVPPIARHGFVALKNALSTGQYAYPDGLWYGGDGQEQLAQILEGPLRDQDGALVRNRDGTPIGASVLDVWLGEAPRVRWYDLHTGLGKWGAHRLFVHPGLDADRIAELRRRHGAETVISKFDGVDAMPNRGLLRTWLAQRCGARDVVAMTAEFGSYGPLKVLKALRAEQRAQLYGDRQGRDAWTVDALREVFVPASAEWRRRFVQGALKFFREAAAERSQPPAPTESAAPSQPHAQIKRARR